MDRGFYRTGVFVVKKVQDPGGEFKTKQGAGDKQFQEAPAIIAKV